MSRFDVIGRPRQRGARRHPTFNRGAGRVAPVITAVVWPVIQPLDDEDTPAAAFLASAFDVANYASSAGSIVSAAREVAVNGAPWTATLTADLEAGDTVSARITVTDSESNVRVFAMGTVAVTAVPVDPVAPTVTIDFAEAAYAAGTTIDASDLEPVISAAGVPALELADLTLAMLVDGTPTALPWVAVEGAEIVARAQWTHPATVGTQTAVSDTLTVGPTPAEPVNPDVTSVVFTPGDPADLVIEGTYAGSDTVQADFAFGQVANGFDAATAFGAATGVDATQTISVTITAGEFDQPFIINASTVTVVTTLAELENADRGAVRVREALNGGFEIQGFVVSGLVISDWAFSGSSITDSPSVAEPTVSGRNITG